MSNRTKDNELLQLRVAMMISGLRQVEVAAHLGVTPGAVSQVLNGSAKSARIVDTIRAMVAQDGRAKRHRAA